MTKNTRNVTAKKPTTRRDTKENKGGAKEKEEKSKVPSKTVKTEKKEEKKVAPKKEEEKKTGPQESGRKKKTTGARSIGRTTSTTTADITPLKTEKSVLNTVNQSNRQNTKRGKEKWAGEESAKLWVNTLEGLNLATEYDEIKKMTVQIERCKVWQTNMLRNRHNDYKCYDDNRVIVQMTSNDYINGSKIYVPDFPRPVLLVQLPKFDQMDAIEEFWRMIFTEQCSSVHLIAQSKELEGGNFSKLFAQENGGYFYANKFFVNTRKVDKNPDDKMDVHVVELLPEGCSNSVICQVYTHLYWKAQGGPEKFYAPIRAATAIAKIDFDKNPVAIVSFRGAGRNSALLTLAVVVSNFLKGITPNISNIVRAIREQRPMSVDSSTQYNSIFLATCWLVKAKVTNCEDVKQRLKKFRDKFEAPAQSSNNTTDNS